LPRLELPGVTFRVASDSGQRVSVSPSETNHWTIFSRRYICATEPVKQFLHRSEPILKSALLSAVIFFAVAWVLGKVFDIESLHQIARIAFFLALAAFVFTNPLQTVQWLIQALNWAYHARPLASLLKDERQAVVWSLFIAEAACVGVYLFARIYDINPLRSVATIAFLAVTCIVAILSLPLVFRGSVRGIRWIFEGVWCSLIFLWRCYRWLNFRRIICLSLGFCGLVLLLYAEEDVRGWWAWRQFKHEWEAKGERFDYASIIPPPVPDDQNFTLTPIVASCYEWALTKDGRRVTSFRTNVVDRLRMNIYHGPGDTVSGIQPTNGDWQVGKMCDLKSWQAYYRTLFTNPGFILTNDFAFPPTPRSPAADVLLALSKYDSDIEELRKASALPYSRFPLNYEDMLHHSTNEPVVLLMHLASIKSCIQVLNLRAIAELENDQSDKALDDVKLELRLVDATRVEPSMTSHYLRTEEMKIVLQSVWEGLAKHKWKDAQLAAIEQELGKLDFLADSQLALRGERNESLVLFDYFRKQRPYHEFRLMFSPAFMSPGPDDLPQIERAKTIAAIICCAIPGGWFYQDKLVIGKVYQQCSLKMTDPAKHLAFPEVAQNGQKFTGSSSSRPWNIFKPWLGGGSEATTIRLTYSQETTDLARIACALERYRLAHNEYPETLDALAPQFIEKIPHDIIGGQPLCYHRTDDDKFLLYSVGWNETNDGGQIGLRESGSFDRTKGDWVWPNP
jgi:hypothetical protein